MKNNALCLVAVLTLLASVQSQAQSSPDTTLLNEGFDAGTPGQSLTAPPFGWSQVYASGDVRIGASSHPGWTGNAVIGAQSPYWQNEVRYALAIPTNGVITFSFDAWAYSLANYGSMIGFYNKAGYMLWLEPWKNIVMNNTWDFRVSDPTTGAEIFRWYSGSNFMRNRTVHGKIIVDYENLLTWGELNDGATNVITPKAAIPANFSLSGVYVYEDRREGTIGSDFDNLNVTASPPTVQSSIRVSAVDICWPSATNRNYQVQYTSSLSSTNPWVNLGTPVAGNGSTSCVSDPVVPGENRSYRVRELY
jgi:hypothetical protein